MLTSLAAVAAGLALLMWSADRFVLGTAGLARAAGISPLIVGMTIVGFGTSAPEIAVSTLAAIQGSSGIAIGNILGSNLFKIPCILVAPALIAPGTLPDPLVLWRDIPLMIAVALMLYAAAAGLRGRPLEIGRIDGTLLLTVYAGYTLILVLSAPAA